MANSRLDDAIKEVAKTKQPERDLWPGIELALAREQATLAASKSSFKPLYAVAASVALVVMVSIGSFYTGQKSQTQVIAEQMSADYVAKREALLVAYGNNTVTVNDLDKQLSDLDDAADVIKEAISDDPNNPVLLQMLKRVYAQQIELIEKVHAPQWQQL